MELKDFGANIRQHADDCYRQMPLMNAILGGKLTQEELRRHARRHYAEIRTFIDFKLPERLRICPHDAYSAKKFFWDIYCEEQGNFVPGKNHAELFKPFCYKLGITDKELDNEYVTYWPHYRDMLGAVPSHQALVHELAISFAWETIILKLGQGLSSALKQFYGFGEADLNYFMIHGDVDTEHSGYALSLLNEYVTDEELAQIAFESVTDSLLRYNYFDL